MLKIKNANLKQNDSHSDNSEMAMLQACREGERNAQFRLFQQYKDSVYNIAYRMSNDSQSAEDITQKVFMRVFKNIHAFRGEAAFSSWLYRITANVCINHFRTASRWKKLVSNELRDGKGLHAKTMRENPEKTELKLHLEKAIRELPEGYRMVFVLHDVEGYRHEEIGKMLGIAVGTSKSQLHKARKELRAKLEPVLALHRAL